MKDLNFMFKQLVWLLGSFLFAFLGLSASTNPWEPFESQVEFEQFKDERKLMECEWIDRPDPDVSRQVPYCSFGGYRPHGPTTYL